MSNLEKKPVEVAVGADAGGRRGRDHEPAPAARPVEILEARQVPLGGPRAIEVRRTLPQRSRSTIGAWCFVDHYGPVDVTTSAGMDVPPHPHTGLQTVSWLFEGEIEHRDSVGSHALVTPGTLNLMTAGSGIAHSEVSTPNTRRLHGVQLWVALPDADRDVHPFFEHLDGVETDLGDGCAARVFVGTLAGTGVAATVFTPLVAAQLDLEPGATVRVPVDPTFEHGVLVDAGPVLVDGELVPAPDLAFAAAGRDEIVLEAGDGGARIVLIGGEPFAEKLVMWWNFVGRDHDEIERFRADWQTEVIAGADPTGRFGTVAGYPGRPLPAPALPTVRLKPRG